MTYVPLCLIRISRSEIPTRRPDPGRGICPGDPSWSIWNGIPLRRDEGPEQRKSRWPKRPQVDRRFFYSAFIQPFISWNPDHFPEEREECKFFSLANGSYPTGGLKS